MKPSFIARIDLNSEQWLNETQFQNQGISTYIIPIHVEENGFIANISSLHLCNSPSALNFTFIIEFSFHRQPVPAAFDTLVLSIRPCIRSLALFCIDQKPLFLIRTPVKNKSLLSRYRLKLLIKELWPEYSDPIFLTSPDLPAHADGVIENSFASIKCLEKGGKLDYDSYRYHSHFRPFPVGSYFIPACHALNHANCDFFTNYSPESYLDWIRVSLAWSYLFYYPSTLSLVYIEDPKAHSQINVNKPWNFERPKLHCKPSIAPIPDIEVGLSNANNIAMAIHVFYPESLPAILDLASPTKDVIDYLITTTPDKVESVASCLKSCSIPSYRIYVVQNHGRDVLPFMYIILPVLVHYGYESFIKVHTKKSLHRDDGSDWGSHLISSMVSEDSINFVRRTFSLKNDIGLLSPPGSIIPITTCLSMNVLWLAELLAEFNISPKWALQRYFVAGSMFAGRVDLFRHLVEKSPILECYEPEAGQVDATLAHAMERFLSLFVQHQGYDLGEVPGDATSAPAFGYQDSRPVSGFSTTLDQKIVSLSSHNNH
jgi:hypothetical protein